MGHCESVEPDRDRAPSHELGEVAFDDVAALAGLPEAFAGVLAAVSASADPVLGSRSP